MEQLTGMRKEKKMTSWRSEKAQGISVWVREMVWTLYKMAQGG